VDVQRRARGFFAEGRERWFRKLRRRAEAGVELGEQAPGLKDGTTRRQLAEDYVRRNRGKRQKTLELEPVPREVALVWSAWIQLRGGAHAGEPVGWADLEAWQRVTGRRLLPWEAQMVRSLDDAFLEHAEKRRRASQPRAGGQG
jgi:hypothetical protein